MRMQLGVWSRALQLTLRPSSSMTSVRSSGCGRTAELVKTGHEPTLGISRPRLHASLSGRLARGDLIVEMVQCILRALRCLVLCGRTTDRDAAQAPADESQYIAFAQTLCPDAIEVKPVEHQGGCSFTLLITREKRGDLVLQFRHARYALDLEIARRAREVYGHLAPLTTRRGRLKREGSRTKLQVLEMSLVPGIRLSEVLPKTRSLNDEALAKLTRLLEALASFFLTGVQASIASPAQQYRKGKVGASIIPRLRRLSRELPTASLRLAAEESLRAVQAGALERLPVVLTHGDLLPSNIMVDPISMQLTGLVDWAEAEDLPFGLALYGVRHVLGFVAEGRNGEVWWEWYEQAAELQQAFARKLREGLPSSIRRADVKVAHNVGVLLWHGFAWDDGKIDRVVNEEDDVRELMYLRAFLETEWSIS